jgi:hypothetical protein
VSFSKERLSSFWHYGGSFRDLLGTLKVMAKVAVEMLLLLIKLTVDIELLLRIDTVL